MADCRLTDRGQVQSVRAVVTARPRRLLTACLRFILADTKQLHERIEELSSRIRELEDALKAAHASPTPHPLLRDELLRLKAPLQTALEINDSTKWAGSSGESSSHDNPTDMLGTLTVDETTGTSSYHGATAVSDVSEPFGDILA